MPPLRLLEHGILGNGSTLHLQLRSPGSLAPAQLGLFSALEGLSPIVFGLPGLLLLLGPLLRTYFTLLQILGLPLLPQIRVDLQSKVSKELWGKRGKIGRNLGLGDLL